MGLALYRIGKYLVGNIDSDLSFMRAAPIGMMAKSQLPVCGTYFLGSCRRWHVQHVIAVKQFPLRAWHRFVYSAPAFGSLGHASRNFAQWVGIVLWPGLNPVIWGSAQYSPGPQPVQWNLRRYCSCGKCLGVRPAAGFCVWVRVKTRPQDRIRGLSYGLSWCSVR